MSWNEIIDLLRKAVDHFYVATFDLTSMLHTVLIMVTWDGWRRIWFCSLFLFMPCTFHLHKNWFSALVQTSSFTNCYAFTHQWPRILQTTVLFGFCFQLQSHRYLIVVFFDRKILGYRLDAKNFAKFFRFSVTSNL
jgi:hypothetical protein